MIKQAVVITSKIIVVLVFSVLGASGAPGQEVMPPVVDMEPMRDGPTPLDGEATPEEMIARPEWYSCSSFFSYSVDERHQFELAFAFSNHGDKPVFVRDPFSSPVKVRWRDVDGIEHIRVIEERFRSGVYNPFLPLNSRPVLPGETMLFSVPLYQVQVYTEVVVGQSVAGDVTLEWMPFGEFGLSSCPITVALKTFEWPFGDMEKSSLHARFRFLLHADALDHEGTGGSSVKLTGQYGVRLNVFAKMTGHERQAGMAFVLNNHGEEAVRLNSPFTSLVRLRWHNEEERHLDVSRIFLGDDSDGDADEVRPGESVVYTIKPEQFGAIFHTFLEKWDHRLLTIQWFPFGSEGPASRPMVLLYGSMNRYMIEDNQDLFEVVEEGGVKRLRRKSIDVVVTGSGEAVEEE